MPKPPENDEDSWVDTPFEPFRIRGPHDRPTPRLPLFPAKVWQCVDCKTWQLDGARCGQCDRSA